MRLRLPVTVWPSYLLLAGQLTADYSVNASGSTMVRGCVVDRGKACRDPWSGYGGGHLPQSAMGDSKSTQGSVHRSRSDVLFEAHLAGKDGGDRQAVGSVRLWLAYLNIAKS